MSDPIPRSEEPTAGSQAAAVSAGAAVVASSLRGAAASAHPIDRPMQLPQPDAAVREPTGSADISELLAGSPEKERADTGNAVEEHRRENRAGIETEDVEMANAPALGSLAVASTSAADAAAIFETEPTRVIALASSAPFQKPLSVAMSPDLPSVRALQPSVVMDVSQPGLPQGQPPAPAVIQPLAKDPLLDGDVEMSCSDQSVETSSQVLAPGPPPTCMPLARPASCISAGQLGSSVTAPSQPVGPQGESVTAAGGIASRPREASLPVLPMKSAHAILPRPSVTDGRDSLSIGETFKVASPDRMVAAHTLAPQAIATQYMPVEARRQIQNADSGSPTGLGPTAVVVPSSSGGSSTPALSSEAAPASAESFPHPPSVSTVAGRKIRSFPPKKPRSTPGAPRATASNAATETGSVGGRSGASSAVGMPRSLPAGVSATIAKSAGLAPPLMMPSLSAGAGTASAPMASSPEASVSIAPVLVAPSATRPSSSASMPARTFMPEPLVAAPPLAAPGVPMRPLRPSGSSGGTIAQVAAFLANGRYSPSLVGSRSPSGAKSSASVTWSAPGMRPLQATPSSVAVVRPASASSPTAARPAQLPVGPRPLQPPHPSSATPLRSMASNTPSPGRPVEMDALTEPSSVLSTPSSLLAVASSSATINAVAGTSTAPTRTQAEVDALADDIFRKNLERVAGLRAAEDAKVVARAARKEQKERKAEERIAKRAAKAQRKGGQAKAAAKAKGKATRRSHGGTDEGSDNIDADMSDGDDESGIFASESEASAPPRISTPPLAPPRRDADGNEIPRRKVGRPRKSEAGTGSSIAPKVKPKRPAVKKNVLMDATFMPSADLFPSDEEPLEEELIMEGWPQPPPPRAPSPSASPPQPKKRHRPSRPKIEPMANGQPSPKNTSGVAALELKSHSSSNPRPPSVDYAPGLSGPPVTPATHPPFSVVASAATPKTTGVVPAAPSAPSALSVAPSVAAQEEPNPVRIRRRALPGVYVPPPPKARKSKVPIQEPADTPMAGAHFESGLTEVLPDALQASAPVIRIAAVESSPYTSEPMQTTASPVDTAAPPATAETATSKSRADSAESVGEANLMMEVASPPFRLASPPKAGLSTAAISSAGPPSPAPASDPRDETLVLPTDIGIDVPLFHQLGRSAVLAPLPVSKSRTPTKRRITPVTAPLKTTERELVDDLPEPTLTPAAGSASPASAVDAAPASAVSIGSPAPLASASTTAREASTSAKVDPQMMSGSALPVGSTALPTTTTAPSPQASEPTEAVSKTLSFESLVDDDDLVEDADLIDDGPTVPVDASEGEEEQDAEVASPGAGSVADADEMSNIDTDIDKPTWDEELLAIEDASALPEEEELIMEERESEGEVELEPSAVLDAASWISRAAPTTLPQTAVEAQPITKATVPPGESSPEPEEELVLEIPSFSPSKSPQPSSPFHVPRPAEVKKPDVRLRLPAGSVPTSSTRRTKRQSESEPEVMARTLLKAPDIIPTASTRRTKRESAPPVAFAALAPSASESALSAGKQPVPRSAKRKADAIGEQPICKKSPFFASQPGLKAMAASARRPSSPLSSSAGALDGEILQIAADAEAPSVFPEELSVDGIPEPADDGVAAVESDHGSSSDLIMTKSASSSLNAPSPAKGRSTSPARDRSFSPAEGWSSPPAKGVSPSPVLMVESPVSPGLAVVAVPSPLAGTFEIASDEDFDLLVVQPSLDPAPTVAHSSPVITVKELRSQEPLEAEPDLVLAVAPDLIAPAPPVVASFAAASPAENDAELRMDPIAKSDTGSPSPLSRRLLDAIGDHIFEEEDRIMHPVDGSLGLLHSSASPTRTPSSPSSVAGIKSDDEIKVAHRAAAVDSDDEMPRSEPTSTPARKRIKLTHQAWVAGKAGQGATALTDEVISQAESISSQDYDNMLQMDSERSSDSEQLTWQEWEDLNRPTKEEVEEMTAYVKERGSQHFIQHYMCEREIRIIRLLLAFDVKVTKSYRDPNLEDYLLIPILKMALSKVLSKRNRLPQYSTWDDAVKLIQNSQRIVVLSGAGISVSCGIPDFRSADGLYAKLQEEGQYDLDDPQQMFDIRYFKNHPEVFYSFAHQIYPSNFTPSPCHRWIKTLEDKGKLLRNYTQNIDTLEHKVGIKKVLQCHGSFATASCLRCRRQTPGSDIEHQIMNKVIPVCEPCRLEEKEKMSNRVKRRKKSKKKNRDPWADSSSDSDDLTDADRAWAKKLIPAIIKPDITFFGEELDDRFDKRLQIDRESVDLLIVIGSSLSVAPVSDLLAVLPHSVPQIMINKTAIRNYNPDINLVGDADGIILLLAQKLGWTLPAPKGGKRAVSLKAEKPAAEPRRLGESNYWIFKGASRTDLLRTVMKTLPKDVDISWVQSDDDADEGSDDDMLEIESDDGEHAEINSRNHHDDAADRDRDLSDHELPTPLRPSRSSRSNVDIEEDLMLEVPAVEPQPRVELKQMRAPSPAESSDNETPNDGRPVWDLIEFDSADERTPVEGPEPKLAPAKLRASQLIQAKVDAARAPISVVTTPVSGSNAPIPALQPKATTVSLVLPSVEPPAKRPIPSPASKTAHVESDDEENFLVVNRYLRSSPVDPPRRPLLLESSDGKLRAALSSDSESDDVLALEPASSKLAGSSSAVAAVKRKRRMSSPRVLPVPTASPPRSPARAQHAKPRFPAPLLPARRSITASTTSGRPPSSSSTTSAPRLSTSAARSSVSKPAPPPQLVNFRKIQQPTAAAPATQKKIVILELESDDEGSIVMME